MGRYSQENATCKKVYAGLGALKRIRPLVPGNTLLRMDDALVLSYFDCSKVWGFMGVPVRQTPEIAKQGRENYNR